MPKYKKSTFAIKRNELTEFLVDNSSLNQIGKSKIVKNKKVALRKVEVNVTSENLGAKDTDKENRIMPDNKKRKSSKSIENLDLKLNDSKFVKSKSKIVKNEINGKLGLDEIVIPERLMRKIKKRRHILKDNIRIDRDNVELNNSKNEVNKILCRDKMSSKSIISSPSITKQKRYPIRRKHIDSSEAQRIDLQNENQREVIIKTSVKSGKRITINSNNGHKDPSIVSNSFVKEQKPNISVIENNRKRKIKIEMKVKENETINKPTKSRKKIAEVEKIDIPIDKECKELSNQAEIYVEKFDIFDVMLNQTNLQFNNNKFYIIQLLKDKNEPLYYVWMRWARVGKIGQMKLSRFNDNLVAAKECFMNKFYDKTKNNWEKRHKFIKVNGKYDLVQIDYSKKENLETLKKESELKLEPIESKLEDKIQDLIRVIFDIKEMNDTVIEMNYDNNKVPLGRLTESQIKAGYLALREIEGLLNEGYSSNSILVQACNTYYTRIPHDFGMRIPPLIRSIPEIKRELELLETLSDIKIALKLINESGDMHIHPLDRHYHNIHCDINLITSNTPIYQLINDYLLLTHGSTHASYNLEMLDLFEVRKDQEWKNFDDKGNRMLLWHGSRTTNYGGIFSQGLRIAPVEAPITGHMFGKGIYFADMSSKSANYIYSTKSKNTGFLLLCEVSLGTCNELVKANSRANKLPPNCHSVKGLGMIGPDQSTWKHLDDGVIVPVGIPLETGLTEKHKGYVLNYNEYIVYKPNQVKMRYLVKVRFNFK